jgi:uncharacterized protein (TIGR03437 family)
MKSLASSRSARFFLSFLLICSLGLTLIRPGRPAQAQGDCKVDCTATVPTSVPVASSVAFAATATASGCASSPTYEWDFGDGTPTALQQNTTHTYAAPGSYTWKLTASAAFASTTIDSIAGGYGEHAPARQAPFSTPVAAARDPQNRGIYIADLVDGASLIRFLNTSDAAVAVAGRTIEAGRVRRLAGGAGETQPQTDWDFSIDLLLFDVRGMAVNAAGTLLYFSDAVNNRIWAYNVSNRLQNVGTRTLGPGNVGAIATAAGGNLAVHPATGEVYIAQGVIAGNRVSKVNANGTLNLVAGNGAMTKSGDAFPPAPVEAINLPLLSPGDILFDPAGNLFIADTGHGRVVRVEAGGLAFAAFQALPNTSFLAGLAAIGSKVYVADGNQQAIIEIGGNGTLVAGRSGTSCDYTSSNCGDGGNRTAASFFMQGSASAPPVLGLEADATGLYILDQGSIEKGRVRYVNLGNRPVQLAGTTIATDNVDTIAGAGLTPPYDTGLATGTRLSAPTGVAIDANGNLFIADTLAGRLRFVNRGSSPVTLLAGTPAQQVVEPGAIVTLNKDVGVNATDNVPANQAGFDTPQGLAVTNQGVFIADSKGGPSVDLRRTGLLRFINTSGASVTFFPNATAPIVVPPGHAVTLAGGGQPASGTGNGGFARNARLLAPSDVAVNQTTGDIFIADAGNRAVRRISGTSGVITSLNLPAAQYTGLAFDAAGRLHIVNHDAGQVLRETAAGGNVFNAINLVAIAGIRDVALDATGNAYVMGVGGSAQIPQNQVLRINAGGLTTVVAGGTVGYDGDGGPAVAAKLSFVPDPINVSVVGAALLAPQTANIVTGAGGELVFADVRNDRIRRIGPGVSSCVKTGTIVITGDNPVPALSLLTPNAAVVGARELTLTVTGSGFVTGSKVRWNGVERQTNYINSTQLIATIPAADLGVAGMGLITVFNPTPGGGVSNSLNLPIRQPNPIPAISSILPARAAVGTAFSLRVTGNGFTPASIVQWKGSNRPTVYTNASLLSAEIPASDLAVAGNAAVTVFNPEPAGGLSLGATFAVTASNPAPTLSRIQPQAAVAGGGSFPLQVFGANFAINSRVRVNGQDRLTTFNDEGWLTAQVTAADVASPGVANVSVFTPTPGGGVTQQLTLPVGTQLTSVPAASFTGTTLAVESIVAAFGTELAASVESATSLPLPTRLGQTTLSLRDEAGKETAAPLFFVSPTQINYLVPAGVASGQANIIVRVGDRIAGAGAMLITSLQPSLFSANANGQGVAAGVTLRIAGGGQQTFDAIVTYDAVQRVFTPKPIDLAGNDPVFLLLYGTGIRRRSALSAVTATIGGLQVPVTFADALSGFAGLDQVTLGPLPPSLAGRGLVDVVLRVDGRPANVVQIAIR